MSSVEEMLREAANEVLQSRIPQGYVLYPNYDQYWSHEQGMFYNPDTELFYRPEDETVYQLNAEGSEYVLVERKKPTYWASRSYRKRALELLGEPKFKKFDQLSVNIAEISFGLVDKIVRNEEMEKEKEYLKSIADNKVALMQHRINKVFKGNRRKKNPHRQYIASIDEKSGQTEYTLQVDDYFDWEDQFEDDSDDEFTPEDEQATMMHQEGYDQAPCMRLMDSMNRLHIITISGGYVGSDRDCEVVTSNQLLPERCAEFGYSEEAACYSIEKLENGCILMVNGNSVKLNSPVDLCQGDQILLNSEKFEVHVHFGNNTCPGCEPGLNQEEAVPETTEINARNIRGEVARRKNLKKMMRSYGIRPDEALNLPIKKRRNQDDLERSSDNSKGPQPGESTIYSGCSAKPLPENQRKFELPTTSSAQNHAPKPISAENKGFKLLKSMGWSEGEGLGKEKQGHVEPVKTELKTDRQGLGKGAEPKKSMKETIMDKTRERFNEKR